MARAASDVEMSEPSDLEQSSVDTSTPRSEPQLPAGPTWSGHIMTRDGLIIYARPIGTNGSNHVIGYHNLNCNGTAVEPSRIGEVNHVDRKPGPRAQEVLDLVLQGLSRAEIAARLDMAPGTVDTQKRILRIIGALPRKV